MPDLFLFIKQTKRAILLIGRLNLELFPSGFCVSLYLLNHVYSI
jgi:hypothetical protein